ncbi:OmpH family outer membrane protein [Rhodalgimonas zhirmunskyi]|uniref:OmpH family outer membrane protein n=1 Tax=Rhodalgimonas zhirmunskyi TaxID=2964767 RepID=A0AAJ1UAA7_9RHOB|nr:OmpH family outer membrane protein [Rhodoalgimonas zhirmunskyi]MDQ2092876.1 OmpH family outer membrane protein [Rhodoalgimonas zhirmunskyi]
MRAIFLAAGLALAMQAGAPQLAAQEIGRDLGLPDSVVLVIDPSRLFSETQFGKRVASELEAERETLAKENRAIEADLVDEEQSLTKKRADMTPRNFRMAADAFDEKVQRIRKEQDQKARRLAEAGDTAQRRFLSVARPVLETVMRETGASVLLDARTVLLGADSVDITAEAILRIDQTIGAGEGIDLLQALGKDTGAEDSAQENGIPAVEPSDMDEGAEAPATDPSLSEPD